MGETVRPKEAARFMGSKIRTADRPKRSATAGIKGENEKNAAFPEPIRIDAKKISSTKALITNDSVAPSEWMADSIASMNPSAIKPSANTSDTKTSVTTVVKMSPMPFQNTVMEFTASRRLRVDRVCTPHAMPNDINIDAVVVNVNLEPQASVTR